MSTTSKVLIYAFLVLAASVAGFSIILFRFRLLLLVPLFLGTAILIGWLSQRRTTHR